uniref:WD domain-containing protein, G-beta repeat-containing protein n=1 Tax=Candidatus Kentrum sp. FW TaxID=2126338 RepID=A0A450TF79_9GAMM|nr:MAG: WD domain-containing protein, G-beta repeat-containing protein [Candidatus Kentron sp. FW]
MTQQQTPSPHPALKLRHTLRGHTDHLYRMALSPDGRILASPSEDRTVRLWEVESGRCLQTLHHQGSVICVGWSPDGARLATGSGSNDSKVTLWDAASGQRIRVLGKHGDMMNDVVWSPDGRILASCSNDRTVRLWDPKTGRVLRELRGHIDAVIGLAWSPDGSRLCSASWDETLRLWDVERSKTVRTLKGHNSLVLCVAWSPDGQTIASGSHDRTVRIWEPESGRQQAVLEGHTSIVVSVAFLDSGRLLAALGSDGKLIYWRTDGWSEVMRVDEIGDVGILSNLAVHPVLPMMAAPGFSLEEINLWEMDFERLRSAKPAAPTVFYVNAKAVLLGDSGVGKSGLGIRMAEKEFRRTASTHGAQFWHFAADRLPSLPSHIRAELTLWDLAGQPEYRLTHQLFLDDLDAALLLFDCSDANDPFRGAPYWAKVLKKQAPEHARRFLVSSRTDVSPVTVDRRDINHFLGENGLDEHCKTSAHTGEGVAELFERLMGSIPWTELPHTSTPKLFQIIREFLLEQKEDNVNLLAMEEIQRAAEARFPERAATQAELDTVVGLLQSRGLVHRLTPRPGENWVLLKPERINQYGASIIQAARNHEKAIGAVTERDVLIGNLDFTGFERLPGDEERIVLEATAELLLRHDLGFREMGHLVFPSQISVTRVPPSDPLPRTEIAYRFSGAIETIHASLVVRLSYTDHFRREDQWRYAVEFSRNGHRLGFSMRQLEEGTGEIEIYFEDGISEFDRVTFIRFITDHLQAKGIDIKEEIRLYCPKCAKEVTNREAIETRVENGKLDIPCQFCGKTIVIPKSVEEHYRRNPAFEEKQQQLANTVERRTTKEVTEFRADQRQYTATEDNRIHILHLSDLHFQNAALANVCRTQLESDLNQELKIKRLSYLVISGDITHRATEPEYQAAFAMVDSLVKRFGLDSSRVVIVPGNHDVNWDLSKKGYTFVHKDDLLPELPKGRHIPAGEVGALVRDDEKYRERFAPFNDHFYRHVYPREHYPPDEAEQFLLVERPEDRILFLGLNSSWQLDHHFQDRASIHMPALSRALDRLNEEKYDNWLRIAVFHHSVTGKEAMNDEFMELLTVNGFQLCLHGHIHEAMEGFHKYDDKRGIRIVGAGTFGAPAREQVSGIPLQYNLLTLDPETGEMEVKTRKKEKPNGVWSADARWGDKNAPRPWYRFSVFSSNTGEASPQTSDSSFVFAVPGARSRHSSPG